MTEKELMLIFALGATVALNLALIVILWAVERFIVRRFRPTPSLAVCPLNGDFALNIFGWALPVTVLTLLMSFASTAAAEALGLDLPQQDLIRLMSAPQTKAYLKCAIALFALLEAPLLEEVIFRRFIFRNMLRKDGSGFAVAAVVSGAIFSLAHFNAVTFLPLWFFGFAMAWIYHRSGRLLATMSVHFLFNLTNLLLLFIFPEMS